MAKTEMSEQDIFVTTNILALRTAVAALVQETPESKQRLEHHINLLENGSSLPHLEFMQGGMGGALKDPYVKALKLLIGVR